MKLLNAQMRISNIYASRAPLLILLIVGALFLLPTSSMAVEERKTDSVIILFNQNSPLHLEVHFDSVEIAMSPAKTELGLQLQLISPSITALFHDTNLVTDISIETLGGELILTANIEQPRLLAINVPSTICEQSEAGIVLRCNPEFGQGAPAEKVSIGESIGGILTVTGKLLVQILPDSRPPERLIIRSRDGVGS